MNMFDRLVEKTLARSPLLLRVAESMEAVALELQRLGEMTVKIAQTVQVHHTALQELYARQGLVMRAIKSNSPDMSMPDPGDKEKAQKPN